jgi:cob(I)alamin adenosyltransferase
VSRRLSIESAVATGRGDDGTTGLLYTSDRVPKDDPRAEAYGTVDEAVAALGLVRADLVLREQYGVLAAGLIDLANVVLRIQRELFVVGAELATPRAERGKLRDGVTRVSPEMVDGLEAILSTVEGRIEMPREFVVPGETRVSAALELARTIIRRAERRTVSLARDGGLEGSLVIPYLNRLADLLWVLARAAEQAEAHTATTARPAGSRSETGA